MCVDPFVVRGKQSSRSNDRVDCNFRFISFRFVLISADASRSQLLVALSRREARYKLQCAVCSLLPLCVAATSAVSVG